jgi:hypothetical protein
MYVPAPNHSVERDRPQAALAGSLRGPSRQTLGVMPTTLLVLATIAALLALAEACARHYMKDKPAVFYRSRQLEVPAEVAEEYFRHQENIQNLSLDRVFNELGQPKDYDDWDFGRLNYNWRSKDRCVRIYTESGSIKAVHLMDPTNTPRWGAALEVIWEPPPSAKDEHNDT